MSDSTSTPARPVSVVTVLFVLALFMVVFVIVRRYYQPATVPSFVGTADNFPDKKKDEAVQWKISRDSRRAALNDLRHDQAAAATTYGWVDQKAGVVRLPIERAMELTVQQYGAKK